MKITEFKWIARYPRIEIAQVTIKKGWWIFATTETVLVGRSKYIYQDSKGEYWWELNTGIYRLDIDTSEVEE